MSQPAFDGPPSPSPNAAASLPPHFVVFPYRWAAAMLVMFMPPEWLGALLAAADGNTEPLRRLVPTGPGPTWSQPMRPRQTRAINDRDPFAANVGGWDPFNHDPEAEAKASWQHHQAERRRADEDWLRAVARQIYETLAGDLKRRLAAGELVASGERVGGSGQRERIEAAAWRGDVAPVAGQLGQPEPDSVHMPGRWETWRHVRVAREGTVPLALAGLMLESSAALDEGRFVPFLPEGFKLRALDCEVQAAAERGDMVLIGDRGGRLAVIPQEDVKRFGIDLAAGTVGPFRQVRAAALDRAEVAHQAERRRAEAETMAVRLAAIEGDAEPMPAEAADAYRDGNATTEAQPAGRARNSVKLTQGAQTRAETMITAEIERRQREGVRIRRDDVIRAVRAAINGTQEVEGNTMVNPGPLGERSAHWAWHDATELFPWLRNGGRPGSVNRNTAP